MSNNKFCELCYCYVCDKPAKECDSWNGNHAHATDTGTWAAMWKTLRLRAYQGRTATANGNPTAQLQAQLQHLQALGRLGGVSTSTTTSNNRHKTGPGPFDPNDSVARSDPNLTACRNCGWFNRYFHRNFQHYRRLHPVGHLDWCHHCGVVASTQDFGKEQSQLYQRKKGDVFLGERSIKFRIFAHKPKEMDRYAAAWQQESASEWKHDDKELQTDVFRHRFGARPTPKMILDSIPIVAPQDIPKTGSFYSSLDYSARRRYVFQTPATQLYETENCGGNMFSYWKTSQGADIHSVSVDETEGILLDNPSDIVIVRELCAFDALRLCNGQEDRAVLPYKLKAKWDKESQTGVSCPFGIAIASDRICQSPNTLAHFIALPFAWFSM